MIFIPLLVALVTILIFWKIIRPASYWKRRGVKQGREIYLLGDSSGNLLRKYSLATLIEHNYNKYPNERYCGLYQFTTPTLMIREPDLIKQLTVKDFDHFTDHTSALPDETIWSKNLFALKGQAWRDMRSTLSPAFTSSKMRAMFSLINECAEGFVSSLYETVSETETLDTKDIFTRFANDVIATCAFGVNCNSLEDRNNEFFKMGKLVTDFNGKKQMLKLSLAIMMPKLFSVLGLSIFDIKVKRFFHNLVTGSVKVREENNIVRPDMIHLLMEARKGRLQHVEDKETSKDAGFATVEEPQVGITQQPMKEAITDDDMTAQALIFFFAGFDSVSTLMCFLSQELAMNPDIQERLREEVDDVLAAGNGLITYETLSKMEYIDMVISETLRLWPAASVVDRVCVKPYILKSERPDEKNIQLEKGNVLWMPIFGLHRDPEHYPNPTKFDPERFNPENRKNIKPYTYIPFGAGPRNCIGSRFALMEAKTIIVHLLSKFELLVVEKTQVPIVLSKKVAFAMIPENGFWLGLKKRN